MTRCSHCGFVRATSPWLTPGGLLLGVLCDGCRRGIERAQRRTERVLSDKPRASRRKVARPKAHRWHPTDRRIAAELLAAPELLGLRTRRLELDVRSRFGVAPCTARNAIAIARRYA